VSGQRHDFRPSQIPGLLARWAARGESRWDAILGLMLLGGLVAIVLFVLNTPINDEAVSSVGLKISPWGLLVGLLLIAGAATIIGGILGFLFAIPRVLSNPQGDDERSKNATTPNTNLEQISDWLTKILVGVGLTQIQGAPDDLWALADRLAHGLGDGPFLRVFVLAALLYFTPAGFLWTYLYTRLQLRQELERADVDIQRLRDEISSVSEAHAEQDAKFLSAVGLVLDQPRDTPGASVQELTSLAQSATADALEEAFRKASELRRNTWRDPSTKPIMERSIPVFEALLETDHFRDSHKVRGQLAFALKDKAQPDWERAEALLREAIRLRDAAGDPARLFYEFNLAICLIEQDEAFKRGEPSPAALQAEVSKVLRPVVNFPSMEPLVADSPLAEWRRLNGV